MKNLGNLLVSAIDHLIISPLKWICDTAEHGYNIGTSLLDPPQNQLDYAAMIGSPFLLHFALMRGASLRQGIGHFQSAMDVAVKYRQWNMVHYLTQMGADPNPNPFNERCKDLSITEVPLYAVLTYKNEPEELAQFMVDHNACVDSGLEGFSLVEAAIHHNQPHVIRFLAKNGAKLEPSFNKETRNLLAEAVMMDRFACAIELMKAGISPNADPGNNFFYAHDRRTILMQACDSHKPEAPAFVAEMMRHGANAFIWGGKRTALHVAVKNKNLAICKVLLDHAGPELLMQADSNGQSPLMLAQANGWEEGVAYLSSPRKNIKKHPGSCSLAPHHPAPQPIKSQA